MREHMPHIDTRVAAISATIAPFVRKVRPLLKLVMSVLYCRFTAYPRGDE